MINNLMFEVVDDNLQFRESGKQIPPDEPVFILLGRDPQAACILRCYQAKFPAVSFEWKVLQGMIDSFNEWPKEELPKA